MNYASHAAATGGARLFDLREPARTPERSAGASLFARLDDRRVVVHPEADRVYVEQYRRLAAAMHHAQIESGVRTLMVASAVAGEGKTLTATNLALMLSLFKRRVLLVDGDLRKPSVHRVLRIPNGRGLSDMLDDPGGASAARVLSPALSVITAGQHAPDPVASLVSDAAAQAIARMRDQHDWVVVDTPPAVLFPDASLFGSRLDACVLVVGAGTTASPAVARAAAAIGAVRMLGVVLNRADRSEIAAGYGYEQYGYRRSALNRGPTRGPGKV